LSSRIFCIANQVSASYFYSMQKVIWRVALLGFIVLNTFRTSAANLPNGQPQQTRNAAYKVEQVSIVSTAGGITLRGSLLLPAGKGPFPAVLLLPDMGAEDPAHNGLLISTLADSLAQKGVVTLRLAERGTGSSGGNSAQTLLTDRLADVAAALNKLRTQPQVDIARIGIIGHGRGGNVALLAGAQPLPPSFIVAIAASGVSGQELLAAQVPMYGKVFNTDYDKLARQRQQTLGQLQMRQVGFQMQAQGASPAQVQAYTDQQTAQLQEADRKWAIALQKHQSSMLEIVVHTPDDSQAQAVLTNMMRQHYPDATPEELQRSAQRMTSPSYRDYLILKPTATLSQVKCPVLLVQGTADTEVNPITNLDALLKGLSGNLKVTDRHLKELDHQLRYAIATKNVQDKNQAPAAPVVYHEIIRWVQQMR
jgi:dienelactone hydrolase